MKRPQVQRLGLRDTVNEALAGILDHPLRSALAAIGTILGVGTVVAVLGLTTTAGNQISRTFTLAAVTRVEVSEHTDEDSPGPAFPPDAVARVTRLPGVEAVGLHWSVGIGEVRSATAARDLSADIDLQLEIASAGYLHAVGTHLLEGALPTSVHDGLDLPVAIVGSSAAEALGIATVANHPRIIVDGIPLEVIGLLRDADQRPDLAAAIVVPEGVGRKHWPADTGAHMLVITRPGAAPAVADQIAVALRPDAPTRIVVTPPPDPHSLRDKVQTDFASLLLALAGVSLLISVFGIANTTTMSVVERRHEIGLRRALGAQRLDIAVQFMLECLILGALGGLLGSSAGVIAVVVTSAAQQWTAVVEPSFLLLGPLLGAGIGALAGIIPARQAARVEPVAAMRA